MYEIGRFINASPKPYQYPAANAAILQHTDKTNGQLLQAAEVRVSSCLSDPRRLPVFSTAIPGQASFFFVVEVADNSCSVTAVTAGNMLHCGTEDCNFLRQLV